MHSWRFAYKGFMKYIKDKLKKRKPINYVRIIGKGL